MGIYTHNMGKSICWWEYIHIIWVNPLVDGNIYT